MRPAGRQREEAGILILTFKVFIGLSGHKTIKNKFFSSLVYEFFSCILSYCDSQTRKLTNSYTSQN